MFCEKVTVKAFSKVPIEWLWVIFSFNASVLLLETWRLCHYATIQQIFFLFFFFFRCFSGFFFFFCAFKWIKLFYYLNFLFLCVFLKKYTSRSVFLMLKIKYVQGHNKETEEKTKNKICHITFGLVQQGCQDSYFWHSWCTWGYLHNNACLFV